MWGEGVGGAVAAVPLQEPVHHVHHLLGGHVVPHPVRGQHDHPTCTLLVTSIHLTLHSIVHTYHQHRAGAGIYPGGRTGRVGCTEMGSVSRRSGAPVWDC